ncbi:MAG: hypothetical protein SOU03_00785, partial [Dorea sp.]|nr:hypothetical protein [Dorea sp.]
MVYDAFRKQRELNLMLGLQSDVEIGGRSGFIFNEKKGQDKLREREYNSELMRLYVVGGGGCMIQNFGEYDKSQVTIVRDIPFVIRDVPDWVRTMSIPKLCSM